MRNAYTAAMGKTGTPRTGGRVIAGEDSAGLSIAGTFAGVDPHGRPLYYGGSPMASPAAAMGLSIAGGTNWNTEIAKAISNYNAQLQPQISGINNALAQHSATLQQIQQSVQGLNSPSSLLQQRKNEALANDRGVLIHDQGGPKRNLLFSIATPGAVPAVTSAGNGTSVANGAPQKPFQPHRMIVAGAGTPTSTAGGTQGTLLTAMYVGSDLQFVNVPGGQSGVPVDVFANNAFDCKFEFDAAYPAIGITLNVANPTSSPATLFNAAFLGKAIS